MMNFDNVPGVNQPTSDGVGIVVNGGNSFTQDLLDLVNERGGAGFVIKEEMNVESGIPEVVESYDVLMKTSRNGKEIRKAYETVSWKSENEINSIPADSFSITFPSLVLEDNKYYITSGQEADIVLSVEGLNTIPNLSWNSSDINVIYVTNDLKKVRAYKTGTASITFYDVNNPDVCVVLSFEVI